MKTEEQTESKLDCWPPLAHIVKRKDMPPKAGDFALCGAKLAGINLDGMAMQKWCKKCVEIMERETAE